MELIRGLHNLAPRHRGCVVTIGNFDGLHLGHQALVARALGLAREQGVPAAAMIFEPTPREFFAKGAAPPRIAGFRGKLRLLERAGIARLLCLRFDRRLAELPAPEFVERILVRGLGVRAVVVGEDFRFGCHRGGDLDLLRRAGSQAGFTAEGLGQVSVDGRRCSSTAVREALALPDLEQAMRLLGRRYRVIGQVRRGLRLGRKLGMPTANLVPRHPPALAHGVYAVRLYWDKCPGGAPGVASLGVRPTLGMQAPVLESHVLDGAPDLYGRELEVEFWRYLRPQQRFDSLEVLAAQMQEDGARARKLFETMEAKA
jgi:riboflavin kinase / FMN adenylyltransferase